MRHTSIAQRPARLLALFLASHSLLFVPLAAQNEQSPPPVTVVTFNIRYGTAPDGENAWAHRKDLVRRSLTVMQGDIIGLQEALSFQIEELLNMFPEYNFVGVGRDDGVKKGEFSPIFYRAERYEPLQHGTFWLSDSAHLPGSTSWGNEIPRVCTWVRLKDRSNGSILAVFNTHWDHISQESRRRSATLMRSKIGELADVNEPVIVTGDFNAGENNEAFQSMLRWAERPLHDSFRIVHPNDTIVGTFNAFRGEQSGDKIDAILVSEDWHVRSAEIDRTMYGDKTPSDHYPVRASLAHE
jgi:endonuclease/exonuclease/phosphatase family metal-dependent hydrolase